MRPAPPAPAPRRRPPAPSRPAPCPAAPAAAQRTARASIGAVKADTREGRERVPNARTGSAGLAKRAGRTGAGRTLLAVRRETMVLTAPASCCRWPGETGSGARSTSGVGGAASASAARSSATASASSLASRCARIASSVARRRIESTGSSRSTCPLPRRAQSPRRPRGRATAAREGPAAPRRARHSPGRGRGRTTRAMSSRTVAAPKPGSPGSTEALAEAITCACHATPQRHAHAPPSAEGAGQRADHLAQVGAFGVVGGGLQRALQHVRGERPADARGLSRRLRQRPVHPRQRRVVLPPRSAR